MTVTRNNNTFSFLSKITRLIGNQSRKFKLLYRLKLLTFIILCTTPGIISAQQLPTEYQVKAAFVYNIIKFVDWPNADFKGKNSIDICIYGKGQISTALSPITTKKAKNKQITIHELDRISSSTNCDVIYFTATKKSTVSNVFHFAQQNHSLTISDINGFANLGGMIELRKNQDSVRIIVNRTAASEAGLTLSSKLLELAVIVK